MARSIRATNLETRTARVKLAARKKPYWKLLDKQCYLGYYRGAKGGSWVARFHLGNSRYKEAILAATDDVQDSNGISILSFFQAQEQARAWFLKQVHIQAGIETLKPKTVEEATREYLTWFKANKKSYYMTQQSAELNILSSTLASTELSKLTTRKIESWLNDMATKPARGRKKKDEKEEKFKNVPFDPRQRKVTANRQLTILKAILNYAYKHGYAVSDEAWKRVKPFHSVDSPKVRFLTQPECKKLIKGCPKDFKILVQAGLLTGCRYGELVRLTAGDYHAHSESLYLHLTKSGKPRHVALDAAGVKFFSSVTRGKAPNDIIFLKEDGSPWKTSHQSRRLADVCKAEKIKPAIGFHILRHTYAAHLAMQGVPLQVIAHQLGHADTRICERHYAHLSPSYVADMVKANLPNLASIANAKPKPSKGKKRNRAKKNT